MCTHGDLSRLNIVVQYCTNFNIFTMCCRNEALRIAYIDEVESVKNGKPSKEYYSKLVKADIHGKDKVSPLCYFVLACYD
jgi:hypothetical protein